MYSCTGKNKLPRTSTIPKIDGTATSGRLHITLKEALENNAISAICPTAIRMLATLTSIYAYTITEPSSEIIPIVINNE